MALSIAQMRESGSVGLPERTLRMCLAQKLVAEVQRLESEKASLAPGQTEDGKAKPRRNGDPSALRIKEIDERLAELLAEMDEHTGTLTIRGISGGEWRRWADDHPARTQGADDEGRPQIHPLDADVAYGRVNVSDLLATLDVYAVAWDGTPFGPGDWEFIASQAAPGDLAEVCRRVVQILDVDRRLQIYHRP